MSYLFSVYAVDLKTIESAVGAASEILLTKIVRSNPEEFDDENDFEPDSKPLLLKDALRNLLAGKAAESASYSQHGYALEELCKFSSADFCCGYISRAQMRVLDPWMKRSPVPLPESTDFPILGFLRHDELTAHIDGIESQWLTLIGKDREGEAKNILNFLTAASKKSWDVVFVYG